MSYPTLLAQQTTSVLLALVPQAQQFTLREVKRSVKGLPKLTDQTLTLGAYEDGGSVTFAQAVGGDESDEQRLVISTDHARSLSEAEWLQLRQFGDSVFRSTAHIDPAVVVRADEIRRAWKMGVEAEALKAREKADKLADLQKESELPWTPKRDPQLEIDFEDEDEDRDAELERQQAEQMAEAVQNGEVIEDDPPVLPPDETPAETVTEGPLAGLNAKLAAAAQAVGVVKEKKPRKNGKAKTSKTPEAAQNGSGAVLDGWVRDESDANEERWDLYGNGSRLGIAWKGEDGFQVCRLEAIGDTFARHMMRDPKSESGRWESLAAVEAGIKAFGRSDFPEPESREVDQAETAAEVRA